MSQFTVTTIAPPVTVVCSSSLTQTMTVTIAPTFMGLIAALDQHDEVLLALLTVTYTMSGVVGLTTVSQQHFNPKCLIRLMPVMSTPGEFIFSGLSLLPISLCWPLLQFFLSAFRF